MKPEQKARLVFYASLVGGVGGWMITLGSWSEACTPVNLGGLLIIVGSVAATALGTSILKPKT